MSIHKRMIPSLAVLFCLTTCLFAADKKSKDTKPEDSKPSYEQPQPATENVDLNMYQRIREEGLAHSHVMEYASGLMDGIGPRSPLAGTSGGRFSRILLANDAISAPNWAGIARSASFSSRSPDAFRRNSLFA